ncbi:MAG: sulfide/dihydroorotate dehydrogenase-like FAD/NAD-binding protein [Candidatus Omnitrophota bacterium]|nr:MAG: sulfide/dihydroorotate dehydrogenase-like FAD/NAD-binding protein [Candidatus Omnitrophota bacterium]
MKVIAKERIAENLTKLVIESPLIAKKALPGQFVVLMAAKVGERVPLTIVDADRQKQTITIIFQEVGYTTRLLGTLKPNDSLYSLVGPLGKPTPIKNYGRVIVLGGGVGIAELLPLVRALKGAGCTITSILGGRTAELVILRDQVKEFSDDMYITTDDGSLGEKGVVTDPLKRLLDESSDYGLVFCVGPVPMMKAVSEVTRLFKIKIVVCLNPIMVDGTGMCGCCRVTVGGETKFTCVDGPDFDGYEVDFDELMARQKRFVQHEKQAMCKLDKQINNEASWERNDDG